MKGNEEVIKEVCAFMQHATNMTRDQTKFRLFNEIDKNARDEKGENGKNYRKISIFNCREVFVCIQSMLMHRHINLDERLAFV